MREHQFYLIDTIQVSSTKASMLTEPSHLGFAFIKYCTSIVESTGITEEGVERVACV